MVKRPAAPRFDTRGSSLGSESWVVAQMTGQTNRSDMSVAIAREFALHGEELPCAGLEVSIPTRLITRCSIEIKP